MRVATHAAAAQVAALRGARARDQQLGAGARARLLELMRVQQVMGAAVVGVKQLLDAEGQQQVTRIRLVNARLGLR